MQGVEAAVIPGRLPFWQEKQSRQLVERKEQLNQEMEDQREEMEDECEADV